MIRGPDARSDKFLTDLSEITRRLQQAQNQITSGKRINRVSDAPDDISRLLQMRSELSSNEQIRFNLGRVQSEVDGAEQALTHAINILERVAVLGAQGGSSTTSQSDRSILGFEVSTMLQQLVNVSATILEGRYIFSGDNDGTAPYELDLNLDDPFSPYQGTASTRQAQHPSGRRFPVSTTAEDIFDNPDPGKSVFRSVNDLRLAMRDGDVQAVLDAVANVRTALGHLNEKLAFYGTLQNQVREGVEYANSQELRLNQQISSVQDADLTAAILEFNEAQFQQQSALQVEGNRSRRSLFDFLR
jgi:flagellar hook-associated protein 3 FlgL